jgi:phosphoserine phosphatase
MKEDKNFLMVIVSGHDRPGITATFSKILHDHNVEVIDIEQASLQNLLGLYLLLDMSHAESSTDSVIKDLLFEASRLKVTLNFKFFSAGEIKLLNQKSLCVLTYFGGTRALAELSRILGEEDVNIEVISSLAHQGLQSVEMVLNINGSAGLSRLKKRIMLKSREIGIDLALQKMEAYRKSKRMIFFDMDSTLVEMEIVDEMARRAGVYREVSRITEKAVRGDLDFEEALRQRVAMLKGLPLRDLTEIRDHMKVSSGVDELLATLKHLGYKLCLVTGGFDFFSDYLKAKYGFDFAFANRLEIKNGALTGRVEGRILDATEKARIVNQTSLEQGILLDQTVAVGDGANDALMLGQAGLGIAYNANTALDQAAHGSLGKSRLMNILHFLGITEEDVRKTMDHRPKSG